MPNNQEPRGLLLLPAYAKEYKTQEECLADWDAGRDFKIYRGPYCSIRDVDKLRADGYTTLVIVWSLYTHTEHQHTLKLEI